MQEDAFTPPDILPLLPDYTMTYNRDTKHVAESDEFMNTLESDTMLQIHIQGRRRGGEEGGG